VRLFVAVVPPPSVCAVLAAIGRPERDGVRWTRADQWHVTLRFLGEVESAEPVIDAVEGAAARVGPAQASLGAESVRVGGVLAVDVDGVETIARSVVNATKKIGQPPDQRRFRGHITLARMRGRQRVPRDLVGIPIDTESAGPWTVDEIHLICSHLGREVRYESLAAAGLTV
jgi:2'-5' RNA ligase